MLSSDEGGRWGGGYEVPGSERSQGDRAWLYGRNMGQERREVYDFGFDKVRLVTRSLNYTTCFADFFAMTGLRASLDTSGSVERDLTAYAELYGRV